jgi:hypothetical protein
MNCLVLRGAATRWRANCPGVFRMSLPLPSRRRLPLQALRRARTLVLGCVAALALAGCVESFASRVEIDGVEYERVETHNRLTGIVWVEWWAFDGGKPVILLPPDEAQRLEDRLEAERVSGPFGTGGPDAPGADAPGDAADAVRDVGQATSTLSDAVTTDTAGATPPQQPQPPQRQRN